MNGRFVPFWRVYSTVSCAPPTSKATKPAGVPPGWSPPPCSLLFRSELKKLLEKKRKAGETCGRAGQGGSRAVPAWLVRASTTSPKNTNRHRLRGWTLHAHWSTRPPRFHVCSIAALFRVLDSTRPCLGDTTHSLGIGSFNSVSFHLHRPGHPLPISQSRAATTSPVTSSYVSTLRAHHRGLSIIFSHSPGATLFQIGNVPPPLPTTRRDQGCPPFPPSRGMCRHGPATGWVPIPV